MTGQHQTVITTRTWISLAMRTALFPVAVLWPAGTWLWRDSWIVIGLWMIFFAVMTILLVVHDPALLVERMKASPVQKGQKGWDKIITPLLFIVGISLYMVPGFDLIRFGWSKPFPYWVQLVAMAVHLPGFLLLGWVMLTNTYLSKVVKIDHAREHHVITGGPYAVVRHPMYSAVIVLILAFPIALGSRYGLIPSLIFSALLIMRTVFEDRTLHKELEGYPAYASNTPYRLLPKVW